MKKRSTTPRTLKLATHTVRPLDEQKLAATAGGFEPTDACIQKPGH